MSELQTKVRAKFKCNEVTKRVHWSNTNQYLYTYDMSPVTSGSEENKSFFEATPSGNLKLQCLKEDFFELGTEYYLDFTKA